MKDIPPFLISFLLLLLLLLLLLILLLTLLLKEVGSMSIEKYSEVNFSPVVQNIKCAKSFLYLWRWISVYEARQVGFFVVTGMDAISFKIDFRRV
jgi:hypothetical protein